jgi:signal transduction histidine kinase/HPt (histidine-containing phosphotransfer) domain-containing protein
MTAMPPAPPPADRRVFAGRIEILYALGRHYLSLPFAALCVTARLYSGGEGILPFLPLVLQIVVAIAAERLSEDYKRRAAQADAPFWARRYTFVSAIAGATWGVGVFFWYVPQSFPAEAYLTLAFLGMTATEFIARSSHRPAYLAHACFSLGPLIGSLVWQGGAYRDMTALLVFLFAAVLYKYCGGMARLLDESIRLKFENAGLVARLSEEKRHAETARDVAEASNRAKTSFVANISHELRTPLNALLGMAQMLDRAELGNPQRNYVKVMLEAGRGLQILLDDVIALTQDDGDRLADHDCDGVHAARTVARLLQPRSWEKRLRLTVTSSAGVPHVAADPRRVRQALLKLADNGLKFTETGGVEIRVEAMEREGRPFVRFAVTDSGLGVPPEIAPLLFRPFTQADSSYARREQGAGLGLAVVQRIVDMAGGMTGFESEPGQGSTFWFALPALEHATADAPSEHEPVAAPSHLQLLAFVADETHKTLARLLEPFGNHIVQVASAAEAAERAGRDSFDAAIVAAAAADMLAAAPGVKLPILALVEDGERAPVSAKEILRWPARAHQLYAALADLRAVKSEPAEPSLAAIDPAAFAALEKSVGTATLIEILKSYIETAGKLCAALGEASDDANWSEAVRLAQDIAGSASGLGLAAMTAAARGLAAAQRQGAGAETLSGEAKTIVSEHQRVLKALANLYPDLVA